MKLTLAEQLLTNVGPTASWIIKNHPATDRDE